MNDTFICSYAIAIFLVTGHLKIWREFWDIPKVLSDLFEIVDQEKFLIFSQVPAHYGGTHEASRESVWKTFRSSRFYVSTFLVGSFILFMLLPDVVVFAILQTGIHNEKVGAYNSATKSRQKDQFRNYFAYKTMINSIDDFTISTLALLTHLANLC